MYKFVITALNVFQNREGLRGGLRVLRTGDVATYGGTSCSVEEEEDCFFYKFKMLRQMVNLKLKINPTKNNSDF